jgi:hypothetical protein
MGDVFMCLKELYQIQLKLHNDISALNLMLKTLLGADEYAPVEELALRATLRGNLVEIARRNAERTG